MNILKFWNETKIKKWLIFTLPPFTGLFLIVYSYFLLKTYLVIGFEYFISYGVSCFGGCYDESDRLLEARKNNETYNKYMPYYILAWIIGLVSLYVFGESSVMSTSFVKTIELIVTPFKILYETKVHYVIKP